MFSLFNVSLFFLPPLTKGHSGSFLHSRLSTSKKRADLEAQVLISDACGAQLDAFSPIDDDSGGGGGSVFVFL